MNLERTIIYHLQRVKAHEDPNQSSDAVGMLLQTLELYLLVALSQASLKQLGCYSKSKLLLELKPYIWVSATHKDAIQK